MLINEAEDLRDLPKSGAAAVSKLLDESPVASGELPECRLGHPSGRQKALNALQNLYLSDHEASLFGFIQYRKQETLDTSSLENSGPLCLETHMSKRSTVHRVASPVYDRLMAIKPDSWTEAQWARQAGVSMSFFSDLKSKGTKPTLEKVERLVEAAGRTMIEYYGATRTARPQDILDAARARDAAIEIFRALGRDEFQAELLAKYILSKSRMTESSEAADETADSSHTPAVGAKDLVRLLDTQ